MRIKAHMSHPEYGTVEVYCEGGKVIGIVEEIDRQEALKAKPKKPPKVKVSKKEA